MKRLAAITITSLLAIGALGGTAAYAEEQETVYPQDGEFSKSLVFSALTDYAIDGDVFAFAEDNGTGSSLCVYDDGTLTRFAVDKKVTNLESSDGVFYYKVQSGEIYSLPEQTSASFEFVSYGEDITIGNYIYYLDEAATLTVYNKSSKLASSLEGFGNLKQYGEYAYAVSENCIYRLNGEIPELLQFEYSDYSATLGIKVGDTADALKSYSLSFVTVAAGSFMTEVSLTALDGEFFETGTTAMTDADTLALLLCYTGNAAIVAIGDSSYITLAESTKATTLNCYTDAEFDCATITGDKIYFSPYVNTDISAVNPAQGMIVNVINKLECENVLGSAFYEIEYSENEQIKIGYVAEGLLNEAIINDYEDLKEITDPDYSEQDDVQKILIIFAVIVLVLIAIGYLTYVGTSGKKKRKKDKAEDTERADS